MTAPPRRWSRRRKVVVGLLTALVVVVVAIAGTGFYLQHRLTSQVTRIPDPFVDITDRPARAEGPAAEAVNILLLGSDKRELPGERADQAEDSKKWNPGQERSDTIMVLHVAADRRSATIVSIPRDSWVEIPGRGRDKVNAAFSYGGPSLTIRTVERLTGLHIDHVAVIGWEGFKQVTDALGGVAVTIPETTFDSARGITWEKGRQRLTGEEALNYVGQRYGLKEGDFDRVRRQQNFLRSMMQQTLSDETVRSPARVYEVLSAVTSNLSVDSGWSTGDMRGLALSMRDLRSGDVGFTTVPTRGTGMEGAQSVVYLDVAKGRQLWRAVREDRAPEWLAANPEDELQAPSDVR